MKKLFTFCCLFFLPLSASAQNGHVAITESAGKGNFPLAVSGKTLTIYSSPDDHIGVSIALKNLQTDIDAVTGTKPELSTGKVTPVHQL